MTDKSLRQDVIDELDFDPRIDAANIGVAVENGVVTLTGHVASYAEKIEVEKVVGRVRGVHAIAQEIAVRYAGDRKTSDDQIAERALKFLQRDVQVPDDAIMVRVEKGWVTLTGKVQWQYQRMAAEADIRKLTGVIGVSNQIEVKPHVEPQDVRAKIIEALKRNAELEADAIRVVVHDGTVRLEGKVKAWYERRLAERAAWSAPGVQSVEDQLALG